MMRMIIAIVAGYAAWTALWLGGNAMFFGEATEVVRAGEPYTKAGPLAGVIVLSVVCSVVAGLVTAGIARARAQRAVVIVAALLLITGIGVQIGVWAMMPLWYHLTFLALIAPVVMLGARLRGGAG